MVESNPPLQEQGIGRVTQDEPDPTAARVDLVRDGAVAVLTINNPARRNALSQRVKEGLLDHLESLMNDSSCRSIVLAGSGKIFCSGGDLKELRVMSTLEQRAKWAIPHRIISLLACGPKPVVAAVEGAAYGAGASLAAACDHVICGADARFAFAFVRMGLMPDLGLRWTLGQRVGPSMAKQLTLFAKTIDAIEAHRIGLADALVDTGGALAAACAAARELAGLPGVALALTKHAFAQRSATLEEALRAEVDYSQILTSTHDHAEAKHAFLEKRPPVFRGD